MNWQGDLFNFGLTQCAECGTLIHQDDAIRKVFYDHTSQQQTEDFCSEHCKQEWYLNRLRGGM